MFDAGIYRRRREALAKAAPDAVMLFLGNVEMPMDYGANVYPFRQDGCFRYFFGLDRPGLAGVIDTVSGRDWLFGDDTGLEGTVWFGPTPSLQQQAETVGVRDTGTLALLQAMASDRWTRLAYTPPYSAETSLTLVELTGRSFHDIQAGADPELIEAIITLREIKAPEEIAEMEAALAVTARMHHAAMAATHPGMREHAVIGQIEGIARGADMRLAYQPVFTGRGEVLHNLRYDRTLSSGELVVNDSGAKSIGGYASDITRTIPVSGRFDPLQRRLYDTVLRAQQAAIAGCRPGTPFIDLHLDACRIMVEDLVDLGLFKGAVEDIVATGAYALCFQCGLGHQIGLDVHDMEALGEDRVGYGDHISRSGLFGLRNLRLAKPLRGGMTVTVEPGLYFIPELIDRWAAERRHAGLIDYIAFDRFKSVGGIRIEDNVLVAAGGGIELGPGIARSADEVEAQMQIGPLDQSRS